jgi:hypothetical protein
VNTGETCDDGNASDDDACPWDCRIDACAAVAGSQKFVQVHFAVPQGALVSGVTVLFDHPEGLLDLPGAATNQNTVPSGTISGTPAGSFVNVARRNFNGQDHAVRVAVASSQALPVGQLFRIKFQTCSGARAVLASDFVCRVLEASDPFLNPVTGVTCSVVVE